jgi:hypothetical protein
VQPFPGEPVAPRRAAREPIPWNTLAAGLLLVAGVLHLLLVEAHLAHGRGAGLFFLALGIVQVAWSALFLRSPSRGLAILGLCFLAAAPTMLYVVTRVWRAPWHATAEAIDTVGVAVLLLQVAAAAALVLGRPLDREEARSLASAGILGLLAGVALYGAALAVEPIDWLAQAETSHGSHGDAHGDHAGGHSQVLFAGTRGVPTVGTLAYYGPTTGAGILQACSAAGQPNQDCWVSYLQHYLASAGAVPAFDALVQLTELDAGANTNSHPLAHQLGYQAYDAYGLDIRLAIRECSYELFQGCIHGALQAHFSDLAAQGKSLNAGTLRAICEAPDSSFEGYVCHHGMGHGVHLHTGYQIHDSLKLCSLLGTWLAQENCYGGVHMENVVGYLDSTRPGHVPHDHGGGEPVYWVDPDDLAYPCNTIASAYRDSCWVMQTSLALHFTGGDFQRTARLCDSEAGPHRLRCHNGVGREAAPWANYDPRGMSQRCTHSTADAEEVCVKAFTAGTILQFNAPQRGADLCPSLPDHQKPWCWSEAGRFAQSMAGSEAAVALCASAPVEYRATCNSGRGT